MLSRVTISLDGMGGSKAPNSVIEGASLALSRHPNLFFKIYGPKIPLEAEIAKFPRLQGCYEIIETTSYISDEEQPIRALKNGVDSSMRKCIDSVKAGEAQACVSGGNTGALMVMSKFVLGEIENIKRPAIVGILPHLTGGTVILDLGANAECDEQHLLQFALMGSCFAKIIFNKSNPTVALLNIGVEQIKGREIDKKAYALLEKSNLNFIGYVEGNDITAGTADVVVTDGFSGNVVLKTAEGAARLLFELLKEGFKDNIRAKLGGWLARSALKKSFKRADPNINNGAVFIGVNGIVVKSHGGAEAVGFANAIEVAYDLVIRDIINLITKEITLAQNIMLKPNLVERIKETSAKILGINKP